MSSFPKISYEYDRIRLTCLFEHPDVAGFPVAGVQSPEAREVFGELRFPACPEDRTYTTASFVTSVDGKIAFGDNPAGPLVAQANRMDPDGAMADFWVLNLMRASADAIFAGAGTMHKEPDGVICIFDQGLEDARVAAGKDPVPWVIIMSLDGTDLRFEDTMFDDQPVIMICTSPAGLEVIREKMNREYFVVGPYESSREVDPEEVSRLFHENREKGIPVIVTGQGSMTDSPAILRVTRAMGIRSAMVESPSYCHSLLRQGLLDEMTLNYSCVYIGGTAPGFGMGMEPATSLNHPHTEMLSLHMHSSSFFYFRHRLVYDGPSQGYPETQESGTAGEAWSLLPAAECVGNTH